MLTKRISIALLALTLVPAISFAPARADNGNHYGWYKHRARVQQSALVRGQTLFNQGRYSEALGYLQLAVDQNGNDLTARLLLGRTLMKLSRYPEAQADLQAAVNLSPGSQD